LRSGTPQLGQPNDLQPLYS
ncbi:hypothetical protein D047_1403B, partial [Vibrio parahaemolyticus VPTS-2010_2]